MRVDGRPERLHPAKDLTKAEAAVFAELVGSSPREQFHFSDRPLLDQYARATALERATFRKLADGDTSVLVLWEKMHRATIALSLRLRLSPQGRKQHPPKGSGRSLSAYERMALGESEDDDPDAWRPNS
jgi:hypothetical protein